MVFSIRHVSLADTRHSGRILFIDAVFAKENKDEIMAKHRNTDQAKFLRSTERYLSESDISRRGPFVIGQEITYADILLFQILHDEGLFKITINAGSVPDVCVEDEGLKNFPYLAAVIEAVVARPNVASFLKSDAYLG